MVRVSAVHVEIIELVGCPHRPDVLGRGGEESLTQVVIRFSQALLQGNRLQRGHRHALAVNGIGTANRIAEHQKARGKPIHLVVASPHGARVTKDRNLAERLVSLQRPQQCRRRELRGHPDHAGQVLGRFVVRQSSQGEDPRSRASTCVSIRVAGRALARRVNRPFPRHRQQLVPQACSPLSPRR